MPALTRTKWMSCSGGVRRASFRYGGPADARHQQTLKKPTMLLRDKTAIGRPPSDPGEPLSEQPKGHPVVWFNFVDTRGRAVSPEHC